MRLAPDIAACGRLDRQPVVARMLDDELAEMLVCEIPPGLVVRRHESVEISQCCDPLGRAIGNAGGDHAAIAVRTQDHLGQVLDGEKLDDVGNMRVEIDVGAVWRRDVQTAQGYRIGLVARMLKPRDEVGERPAATPTAWNQNETSHRNPRYCHAESCVALISGGSLSDLSRPPGAVGKPRETLHERSHRLSRPAKARSALQAHAAVSARAGHDALQESDD